MDNSYVYVLFRPNGLPCYVGKGKRDRINSHFWPSTKHTNKHLDYIIRNAGGDLPKIKIRENLTDQKACDTEIALIKAIGRFPDGPLVNMTDGGDGKAGSKLNEEQRAKLSKIRTGKKLSLSTKLKIGAAHKGKLVSFESRQKMRLSRLGKKNSKESISKMSAARKGKKLSSDHIAKAIAGRLAMSPERYMVMCNRISETKLARAKLRTMSL